MSNLHQQMTVDPTVDSGIMTDIILYPGQELRIKASGNVIYDDTPSYSYPEGRYLLTGGETAHSYDPENVELSIESSPIASDLPFGCLAVFLIHEGDSFPSLPVTGALYPKRDTTFFPEESSGKSFGSAPWRVYLNYNDITGNFSDNTGGFIVDIWTFDPVTGYESYIKQDSPIAYWRFEPSDPSLDSSNNDFKLDFVGPSATSIPTCPSFSKTGRFFNGAEYVIAKGYSESNIDIVSNGSIIYSSIFSYSDSATLEAADPAIRNISSVYTGDPAHLSVSSGTYGPLDINNYIFKWRGFDAGIPKILSLVLNKSSIGDIALNSVASFEGVYSSSFTYDIEVEGDDDDRFLIISTGFEVNEVATGTITSVKVNGDDATFSIKGTNVVDNQVNQELWYFKNPAVGTNTIVVTVSNSPSGSTAVSTATCYSNVNQTSSIQSTNILEIDGTALVSLPEEGNWSVEGWFILIDDLVEDAVILTVGDINSNACYSIIATSGNKFRTLTQLTDHIFGSVVASKETANAIYTGKVYHFVYSYDGNFINHYLNGIRVGRFSSTRNLLIDFFRTSLFIGANSDGTTVSTRRNVDEIAVYNYALPPSRVEQHFIRGISAVKPVLTGSYVGSGNVDLSWTNWR